MNISDFKDKLFKRALAEGFEDCEIYYQSNDSFKVSVYKGKIEKYQDKSSSGFGFRGIYNGSMGYFFSENIDCDIIDLVVKNAKESSAILKSDEKAFIFDGSDKYSKVKTYDESINNISVEDKIKMAFDMEKAAYDYDDRINSVNTSMISTGEGEIYIANTKGMELREKSNCFMALVEASAKYKDNVKEKYEIYIGSPLDFDAVKTAESCCKKTIAALGGNSIKSGKIKTVIKNEAFADIMECFVGNFFAENVQKGFSLLKNKIGENIASNIVTITDNPLLDYGMMTAAFDSEGVAAYSKNVVEKGVLKTYLYNLKSADKDGVKSTGNGFKGSFKGAVKTACTNFYIEKGNSDFNSLLNNMETGIFITEVMGLHSGANSVSGDFSLAAEGFVVENGKIGKAVEQITIAGNFYNMIKNIKALSDDLKFNTRGIGSPSVYVGETDIAGL